MQRLAIFGISLLIGLGFWYAIKSRYNLAAEALQTETRLKPNEDLQKENQLLRDQVQLLRDSDTRRIALTDGSNKANAFFYYNPLRKTMALDISTMPAPPAGKKYWLWGMRGKTYEILGPIPQQAASSWHPMNFVPDLERFMVAEGTEQLPTSVVPEVVIMNGGEGEYK
jgi:hypothetical protein